MPVTVKKNHEKVKRMMRVDVARGQNRAFDFLVKEAKANAPVRTGHLRASIQQHLVATPDRPRAAAKVGASYGVYVDQGTSRMAGTFFWTRAVLATYVKFREFFTTR